MKETPGLAEIHDYKSDMKLMDDVYVSDRPIEHSSKVIKLDVESDNLREEVSIPQINQLVVNQSDSRSLRKDLKSIIGRGVRHVENLKEDDAQLEALARSISK